MLNLITGLVVDIFFCRSIAKAGNELAKDPEYIKNIKKIKQLDQELVRLQQNYYQHKNSRLVNAFISYGIDLYDLDEGDRAKELYALSHGIGKYKNLNPLDKNQQELNRQLLQKRERIETEATESQKIASIKAHLKSEQKRKSRNMVISLIAFIFGVYLLFKNYIFFGGIFAGFGCYFFLYNYKAIKRDLKSKQ